MPGKIKTVILLGAGEGTRLRPLTFTRPKPIIPILDRPFISHILENLSTAGITKAVFITGYLEEQLIPVAKAECSRLGIKPVFITQDAPLGTGHAFSLARQFVKDERFLCMCADNYYVGEDLQKFVSTGEKTGNYIAGGIRVEDPRRFGVFSLQGKKIVKVVEKPENPPTHFANASLYLFDQSCFSLAEKLEKSPRGEYEITDVLKILAGRDILEFFELSYWTDLGSPWDILDLNSKLLSLEKRGKIHPTAEIEKGATLKGVVFVGKNSVVKSGAYIEGPAFIGEDCTIGPNCFIRSGTVLGKKTKVGNAVEIKNSTFFGDTNISHLSYCADSVVGTGCNFGAGTITANLRHDKGTISVNLNGHRVNSGRRKLGAFIGDNSKTGIHCSIYPGKTIGSNSWTDSASLVDVDVPKGHFLKRDGRLEQLRI